MSALVAGRDLHSDARLVLRHNGVVEARHVDALLLEFGSVDLREFGIVEHHRANGTLGGLDVKSCFEHPGAEVLDIGHETVVDFVALVEHFEGLDGRSHHRGRNGVGKEVGAAALTQHVDDFLATGGKSAHCTAEGFAERTGVEVYAVVGVEELGNATAGLAYNTGRMTFVDHDQGIVLFGQVANLVDGRHVAIHRKDAIGHDDAEALLLRCLQLIFEVGHVGVGIAVALGLAQAHAVDDGGVVEGIADDGIFGREQGLEHTAVGIEAGGIEDGVFSPEEVGDGGFELLVQVLRAADKSHHSRAYPSRLWPPE